MDEENTESHWAAVAFMTTPEFLYFHSILIGLQVARVRLFIFDSLVTSFVASWGIQKMAYGAWAL